MLASRSSQVLRPSQKRGVSAIRASTGSNGPAVAARQQQEAQHRREQPRNEDCAVQPLRRAGAALLSGLVSASLMLPGARPASAVLCGLGGQRAAGAAGVTRGCPTSHRAAPNAQVPPMPAWTLSTARTCSPRSLPL